MRRHSRRIAAIGIFGALAVVAAACGDDEDAGGTTTSAASGSEGTAGNGGSDGDFQLDEPVKLVFLWEIEGESPNGVSDNQNGAMLAVEEINAAGGIGGHEIEAVRISTSPTDVQAAVASFLEGVDENPVAFLGPAASGAVIAMAPQIERTGIPFITVAQSPQLALGGEAGNEFMWMVAPSSTPVVDAAVDYAVNGLGAERVGLMATDLEVGVEQVNQATELLQAQDLDPVAARTFPFDIQDLTEQVLAMEGSEAILNFGYPANVALQVRQGVQNGIDVPVIGNAAIEIMVQNSLLPDDLLGDVYGVTYCDSRTTERDEMVTFAESYRAEHGEHAAAMGVSAYDSVYILKAAIELAQSTEPDALNEALAEVEYNGGACQSSYRADGAHYLGHELVVVRYDSADEATVENVFTVDDVDAG